MQTQAAVIIPVIKEDELTSVLYLRRSSTVKTHKNQVCFPGGIYEDNDKELTATAIRETKEETGIEITQNQIVDTLGPFQTISGFMVTAFTAIIPKPAEIILDNQEIAEHFTVPIEYLKQPENLQSHGKDFFSEPMYYINYNQYNIWGVTARITKHFLERGVLTC